MEDTEGARRVRPKSVLGGAAYSTDVATKEYRALMGSIDFSNPKPVALLEDLVTYATNPHSNDIIMDFFSGSATTAHGMFLSNLVEAGNRRFVLVQLPENATKRAKPTRQATKTSAKSARSVSAVLGAKSRRMPV